MDIFKLKANKSSIKTELLAGLTTFLSVAYIVPLNAKLVSLAGLPFEALIIATALISFAATALCAFISNTPVIISVAMGLNAYFTFEVVLSMKIPWQNALGAVFISGFIFFILSFTNFRLYFIRAIPQGIKSAISAGIGLFICFIGFNSTGLIKSNLDTLLSLGDFSKPSTLMSVFCLILLLLISLKNIKIGYLLVILSCALLSWLLGLVPFPEKLFSIPNVSAELGKLAFSMDLKAACSLAMLPIILSFFVTQLFDSIGVVSSIGVRQRLFAGKKGEERLTRVLNADAAGSVGGALLGTTTVTTLVESEIGVQSGARTGLSALITALCFGLSIFAIPLFKALPPSAIYPMLIIIGLKLFEEVANIDFKDPAIGISSFFIIILMPLTYSMTLGFSLGFLIFIIVSIFSKKYENLTAGVWGLGILALIVVLLSV